MGPHSSPITLGYLLMTELFGYPKRNWIIRTVFTKQITQTAFNNPICHCSTRAWRNPTASVGQRQKTWSGSGGRSVEAVAQGRGRGGETPSPETPQITSSQSVMWGIHLDLPRIPCDVSEPLLLMTGLLNADYDERRLYESYISY